jgi:hypothetical protein
MAARKKLRLEKCRRRDPSAPNYGTYQLVSLYNEQRMGCQKSGLGR